MGKFETYRDGHLTAAEKKDVHDADCQLQNEKHNCKKK